VSCAGVRGARRAEVAVRAARAAAVAGGLEVCLETVRVLPLIEQLFA
jgi:hypothetical protein